MKRALIFAAILLQAMSGPAGAATTMDVYPSLAPNVFGSPSWGGYVANALAWLEAESGPMGDPTADPTAYKTVSTIGPYDNLVTSFNSWQGVASPGAPFAAELGNRLHFGLHIVSLGSTFTLSGLKFAIHSTDSAAPGDSLAFVGDFIGFNYSLHRVGIDYGSDGIKGTADDIVRTSGSETLPVNELIYVGAGNAWWPEVPADGATPQDALDNVASWVGSQAPFTITGTYELYTDSTFTTLLASDSATVDVVTPEPTTLLLWGATALGLAAVRRWRNRREV